MASNLGPDEALAEMAHLSKQVDPVGDVAGSNAGRGLIFTDYHDWKWRWASLAGRKDAY